MSGWVSKRLRAGALAATGALIGGAAAVATYDGGRGGGAAARGGLAAGGPGGGPAAASAAGAGTGVGVGVGAAAAVAGRQDSVAFTVTPGEAPAGRGAVKTIGYLGRGFTVPAAWKVVDLAAHPTACVRFDVHAVYVGIPGSQQDCPARGVGRHAGAMLIQPNPARSASSAVTAVDHPASAEIDATAPGMTVTASYGEADRAAVVSALTAARLASPAVSSVAVSSVAVPLDASVQPDVVVTGAGASGDGTAGPSASAQPSIATRSSSAGSSGPPFGATNTVSGLGFDACAAPSASAMSAWTPPNSPFTAIGIYIGGSERACAQPNLTAAWVNAEAQAGWHFMPLYVGWQAAWDYDPSQSPPALDQLGRRDADDAVAQAQALGFAAGSVLYYDMEAYSTSAKSSAAMTFLSAWSTELRAKGYRAAVYSSLKSGIRDLVAGLGKIAEPDVIDVAAWNGIADAAPGAAPSADWPHERVHQFQGGANATYSGVTINIDRDFFDLDVPGCAAALPTGPDFAPFTGPGAPCALRVASP